MSPPTASLSPVSSARLIGMMPSSTHPRYLCEQLPGGVEKTFIPVGLNLCFPRFDRSPEAGLLRYRRWFDALAEQGGNFVRLWLGHPFFDAEAEGAGAFSEEAARRLDAVLDLAAQRGIRVKLTLEHFRTIGARAEAESFPGAANFSKPVYSRSNGGYADDMAEFLDSAEARRLYLRKVDWLAGRYAGHPAIFGWELWNEMNAVSASGWLAWTRAMLPELRRRFPGHLVMQSLGSFDRDCQRGNYADYARLPVADLVQAHRYIDPGAPWPVCQAPMDVLCADAVRDLRELAPAKPVLLAECGAVEANHSSPSSLYENDREGVLLHDMLFAPFFAGAAGPGQAWHWDFYVERHALWWHFGRFLRATADYDPVAEQAMPLQSETERLRIYALRGRHTTLAWCRDKRSGWRDELSRGVAPEPLPDEALPTTFAGERRAVVDAVAYDPWLNRWSFATVADDGRILLPAFTRSCVLKLVHLPS